MDSTEMLVVPQASTEVVKPQVTDGDAYGHNAGKALREWTIMGTGFAKTHTVGFFRGLFGK